MLITKLLLGRTMTDRLVQVRNWQRSRAGMGFEVWRSITLTSILSRKDFLASDGAPVVPEVNAVNLLRRNRSTARKAEVDVLGTDLAKLKESQLAAWRTITSEIYLFQTF